MAASQDDAPRVDPSERPIEIKIGPEGRIIFAPGSLISKRSKFFAAALNANRSQPVPLPEEDPDLVSAYVQWLYHGKVSVAKHDSAGHAHFLPSIFLYCLGERLIDDTVQDYVLSTMVDLSKQKHPAEGICSFPDEIDINTAYSNTPVGSPLRRLLVDMYTVSAQVHWVEKTGQESWDIDVDFKDDLIVSLLASVERYNRNGPRQDLLAEEGHCKYHKHGVDQPCSTSKV